MAASEKIDREEYLSKDSENEFKIVYANDELLNFWSTFDVIDIELSPVEQAEKTITNGNKSIWVSEYLLENAKSVWLWNCNYAQNLRKDIENIKLECNNLTNSIEKFQEYLKRTNGTMPRLWKWIHKIGKKIMWSKTKTVYDIEYEKILWELNAQVDKVNWIIKHSENNQALLISRIENEKKVSK